jgi:hypothetical protein
VYVRTKPDFTKYATKRLQKGGRQTKLKKKRRLFQKSNSMKCTWALKEVTSTGNEANFICSLAILRGKITELIVI